MFMRRILYILLGLLALIFLVLAFLLFRYFEPDVGFKYYEPAYLPPGVSIKEKRIDITHMLGASETSTSVEQNFRTENWVYEIQEYPADYTTTIGTADQNYDPKSVKPTCDSRRSPGETQYRLCHWIDYGRIDVHEVKFIKDGTFVNVQIPTTLQQPVTIQEIDRFVDSFQQRSTIGIPVLRCGGSIC
jgi:hypothetical protein